MTPQNDDFTGDRRRALAKWAAWVVSLVLLFASVRLISGRTVWAFAADGPRQALDLARRGLPPEWSWFGSLLEPLWETINMATLGTLVAMAMALPIAFLAARNTAPWLPLRWACLGVIVASRSINSLVWALLLVAIVGPGVLAGAAAIALRSIGFIAKLVYEAVEEISPEPVEALRATGAGRLQVFSWSIVPQVFPTIVGVSVFRWDINIREAAVLGLVGAGGIGLPLEASIASLEWSRVSLILLVILGLVVISELISKRLRTVE